MKRFFLFFLLTVFATSFSFAKSKTIVVTNIEESEETYESQEDSENTKLTGFGFGLSILGPELSYASIQNNFEFGFNLAFASLSEDGQLFYDITSDSSYETYKIVTPKLFLGYNLFPFGSGWKSTVGAFIAAPVYFDSTTIDTLQTVGFFYRGARRINERIEFGFTEMLPFVVTHISPDSFYMYSIATTPGASFAALSATLIMSTFDFKIFF